LALGGSITARTLAGAVDARVSLEIDRFNLEVTGDG
jgi:hypothetical protein